MAQAGQMLIMAALATSTPLVHRSQGLFEYDYSDWYLLKLAPENGSVPTNHSNEAPSLLCSALLDSLAHKLAVPAYLFTVNSFNLDSEEGITANLSVVWSRAVTVSGLHLRLTSLQLTDPDFPLHRHTYSLALLLHARKQHVYLAPPKHKTAHMGSSLGLLLSLLLGGLGLFMLVLAGAFLLVLLLGAGYRDTQEEVDGDLEELLEEQEQEQREEGGRGKVARMVDRLARLYQRVIHRQETLIVLK